MLHGVTSLTKDAAIEGIVFDTALINMPSLQVDFSELFHRNHRIQYIIEENDENYDEKWLVKIESNADQVEFADLLDYTDYIEEVK